MIKNYLKTAWRSLQRNKSYTFINITGLAIGIAACLLIFLVIDFETSFDNYHPNKENIYRVITRRSQPEGIRYKQGVPFPTSAALRLDYSDLKGVTVIYNDNDKQLSVGNNGSNIKKFKEKDMFFAEPQFFNIFKFDWVAGNKQNALNEPNTVVLTQQVAAKYFESWQNAMGKTIRYDNKVDLKVTGILKDLPQNTDLPVNIAISYSTLKQTDYKSNLQDWHSIINSHACFVVLPSNVTAANFNARLVAFVKKYKSNEDNKDAMELQPLSAVHTDARVGTFSGQVFSKDLINALTLIGIFLLVIACVNFINLATAQAVNRSKEVGIRKVLGSRRKQLIIQFLSETFIITLFAIIAGTVISEVALPYLNTLLDLKLAAGFVTQPTVLMFLAGILVGVTFLSGFYPALVLSGFNPIAALKNKVKVARTNGITLRRSLVVLQFGIAQVLVIGTIVIISQLNHFKNTPLGFDKDAVIITRLPNDSLSRLNMNALRNDLQQQPGVKSFSYSYGSPSDNMNWGTTFKYDNRAETEEFRATLKWADAEYFKLYDLAFVAGKPYVKSDSVRGYVVNQAMLRSLGVTDPNKAIGKNINIWDESKGVIVGVVKDFNTTSLREQIPPVIMASWTDQYQTANIKLENANIKETLAAVERSWNKYFPQSVYEYKFLDEKIANFYRKENQLSQLYKIFAGIAIFISCLGLYGMVSFMAVQRTKEVGIRKTLGASVSHIVYMFSKEFTLLIVIAFVIAAPVAYYFTNQWLQEFTYKIRPGAGIFAASIVLSVIIAWLTVGYKAVKAALVNPVKSLRSE